MILRTAVFALLAMRPGRHDRRPAIAVTLPGLGPCWIRHGQDAAGSVD